jgi:hypothetical protein
MSRVLDFSIGTDDWSSGPYRTGAEALAAAAEWALVEGSPVTVWATMWPSGDEVVATTVEVTR